MQAIWRHRRALVERGPSGRFGRRGLPFIALFIGGVAAARPGRGHPGGVRRVLPRPLRALVAWLAVLAIQPITAILAFRLDREPLRPLGRLPLQQFVYRQVMYLVLVHSAVTALTGGACVAEAAPHPARSARSGSEGRSGARTGVGRANADRRRPDR